MGEKNDWQSLDLAQRPIRPCSSKDFKVVPLETKFFWHFEVMLVDCKLNLLLHNPTLKALDQLFHCKTFLATKAGCPTPPPCQDDAAGERARCWGTCRSWRWRRGWSRRERRSWRAQTSAASQAGPTDLWGQYILWDPKKFRLESLTTLLLTYDKTDPVPPHLW